MRMIPLLAFALAAYAVFALIAGSLLTAPIVEATLPSGAVWSFVFGDLVVALGLVLLFLEILKATRTSVAAALDHALSMLVCVLALLGFLLVPALGTTAFLLLFLMTVIDVIAGFTVSLMGGRRDLGFARWRECPRPGPGASWPPPCPAP